MSKPAIIVDSISKAYRIGLKAKAHQTFREALVGAATAPWRRLRDLGGEVGEGEDTFWALKDISFEVQPGEVVGIIGRNGAGKSTLLKVLSRITEPTAGEVRLRGRVASLLEVGTGFHPELTGRENIYLNGAMLGMKRAEITRKFDEIVAFAEVDKFLDTPVKYYSSGMYVRLAFAVAAHLEPEILIVDEVLAVGDAEFQKKCLGKMQDVSASQGRTVLFVSHNMGAISALCSTAVVLNRGVVSLRGNAVDAVSQYLGSSTAHISGEWSRNPHNDELQPLCLEHVALRLSGNHPHLQLHVSVRARSCGRHQPAFMAVDFFDPAGAWIMQAVPQVEPFIKCSEPNHEFNVVIDLPPLIPGTYRVGIWLGTSFSATLDENAEIVSFDITNSPTAGRTVPHSPARGYIVPASKVETSLAAEKRILV